MATKKPTSTKKAPAAAKATSPPKAKHDAKAIPQGRITPSEAYKLAKADKEFVTSDGRVKTSRYLRENGIRPPLRLIRVTGVSKKRKITPTELWAVDESEAVRQTVIALEIKDIRAFKFRCVILKE